MNAGRRILVTGASKGIGRATLDRLRADGYEVVGLARSRPDDLADDAQFHQIDVSDLAATRSLIERLAADRPFYGLINNAAIASAGTIMDTTPDEMNRLAHLNVNALLVCTQAVLPGMRAQGVGRIVNVSSRAAMGKAERSAYSASKAALLGLTRTWALELGADGITVNAIAPGPVATEMFNTTSPPDHPRTQALMASVPVQRVGQPDEIAHAVAYLVDARAGFMTGQTLHIDGGLTVSATHL